MDTRPPRTLRFRSRRTTKKKNNVLLPIAGLAVVCIVATLLVSHMVRSSSQGGTITDRVTSPTPTPYFHNIALLGYGGGTHDGGALTDSIIVARVDDRAKKVFLISIPRDLWVELPVDSGGALVGHKINAAYALGVDDSWYTDKPTKYRADQGGGGALARYALERVIGAPIDHFVAVSFDAFTTLVDTLGGITITRDTPFTDIWYPVDGKETDPCGKSETDIAQIEATLSGYLREQEFPCRFETISFGVGTHELDGATALKYARSRHSESEGGDFYRSQRQRQIVEALKSKVLTISAIPRLVSYATQMFDYIDTDYRIEDIRSLIEMALTKRDYEIVSVALTNDNVLTDGTGPNGEYILTPQTGPGDFPAIQGYLADRYRGLSDASASARFAISLTPTSAPSLPPRQK